MAYVYQKKTDDQQDQGGVPQTGSQNLVSDTDSGSISGGGPDAARGNASGSGWTNLQSYVGANQGESARAGERVAADVRGERETTKSDVEQFGKSDISGYDKAGDTFLADLREGRASGDQTKKLYGQDYRGPTEAAGVTGYGDTRESVADYGRKRATLEDPNKIIEEYNPGSNIGEKSLDRFFYQQKPAQDILSAEYKAGEGLGGVWDQAQADVTGRLAAEQAGLTQQTADIKGAFDQGLSGLEGQFNPAYSQKYVDEQNAGRRQEFDKFMKGEGRGGRVGDFESGFGDTVGYDWNKMFGYGGDTKLGDYVDQGKVANYRDYLGKYGDTFGAKDRFGGADLSATGARQFNPVGTADHGQKSALAELGSLYNRREGDRSLDQGRWDELLGTLGVQGFSDARALPLPPAPEPAPPAAPTPTDTTPKAVNPTEEVLKRVLGDDYLDKIGNPSSWDTPQEAVARASGTVSNAGKKLDPRNW